MPRRRSIPWRGISRRSCGWRSPPVRLDRRPGCQRWRRGSTPAAAGASRCSTPRRSSRCSCCRSRAWPRAPTTRSSISGSDEGCPDCAVRRRDLAAAGGEPRRRGRRRPRRGEPRARRVSACRRIAGVDHGAAVGIQRVVRRSLRVPIAPGPLVRREPALPAARVAVGGGRQGRARLVLLRRRQVGRGVRQRRADDRRSAGQLARGRDARARLARRARHRVRVHDRARQHLIYGEEMPATLTRLGELSRTDQLFTALQDTGLAVDVRTELFDAKTRERVYQQTDTHWNERGALPAYQRIIAAVRARVPRTPAAWTRDDFTPAERTIEGLDLAGMMGLTRVLREVDLTLVPKRTRRARVIEPAGGKPTDEEGRLVTEIDDPSLPRAVIFRDS